MKNKEIIIDGVDVSKCYRFARKTGYCEGAFRPEELPFCESFDCDFKRLKRKERECNNYKQARREKEVLELISQGFSNSEIAEKLLIQPSTLRTHLTNLYDKYNLSNTQSEKSVIRTRLALRYLQETGRLEEEIKC